MRVDYDVIVVGAGPAGSTTAYELARRGVRVGLFEKQRLPRTKPCGGCLSLKIDRILAPDFHRLIERTIYGVRFTCERLRPIYRRSDDPVAYMVMRDRFDAFLAARAQETGAMLHEGEAVRAVREQEDGVEVETALGAYQARFVVGADGATGIVARDGYVIYAFASAPAEGMEQFYANLIERLVHRSLCWRFLTKEERPYHDCAHSSLATVAWSNNRTVSVEP